MEADFLDDLSVSTILNDQIVLAPSPGWSLEGLGVWSQEVHYCASYSSNHVTLTLVSRNQNAPIADCMSRSITLTDSTLTHCVQTSS